MMKKLGALAILFALGALLGGCFQFNQPPVAVINATPQQGETPLVVSFSAESSYDSDGSIVSYAWDFGDTWSDTGEAPAHTYTFPGTYTVTLTVTDDKGEVAHATLTITVEAVDTYDRIFRWESHGLDWQWEMAIPKDLYWHYRNQANRPPWTAGDWNKYVTNPDDDAFIESLSGNLRAAIEPHYANDPALLYYGFLQFALHFVEAAIPYRYDTNDWQMDEWPRYPVETLVEGMGDCEDTSILFTSIVRPYVPGVHLLILPGHCAAAVPAEWWYIEQAQFPVGWYEHGGSFYVYVETTGDPPAGSLIGQLPDPLVSTWATDTIHFFDVGRQVTSTAVMRLHRPESL